VSVTARPLLDSSLRICELFPTNLSPPISKDVSYYLEFFPPHDSRFLFFPSFRSSLVIPNRPFNWFSPSGPSHSHEKQLFFSFQPFVKSAFNEIPEPIQLLLSVSLLRFPPSLASLFSFIHPSFPFPLLDGLRQTRSTSPLLSPEQKPARFFLRTCQRAFRFVLGDV